MAVEPMTIAAGIANVTAALPVLQDAMTYSGNWLVSNTIGAILVAMVITGFGMGLIVKLIRGRRGRR